MNFIAWTNSLRRGAPRLKSVAARISWRVWIAAACLGLAWLWLYEHDARLRQTASLAEARRDAAAQVAGLKKQSAAALHAANVENARAIAQLQARRQELDRRDRKLTAQLAALQIEEQSQAGLVAALPTSEVVTRVAAQLGLAASDLATVGAVSSAGTASVGAGLRPTLADPRATETWAGRRPAPTSGLGSRAAPAAADSQVAALPLSASGARKVEAALLALDSCRARSRLEEQQISNCRELAAADAQTIERQSDSLAKLNQALAAKDQILERQQAAQQAELRAARGTFWGRLGRTARHVAIGVAVGVALGVAVR